MVDFFPQLLTVVPVIFAAVLACFLEDSLSFTYLALGFGHQVGKVEAGANLLPGNELFDRT